MRHLFRAFVAVFCAAILQPAAVFASEDRQVVAVTFDDLPLAKAKGSSGDKATEVNESIRRVLIREGVPSIGFVTEKHVATLGDTGRQLLRDWISDGFDLGNHGATHADSNQLEMDDIRNEITDGESTIRPLTEEFGRPLRFYRFAYNHIGNTEPRRVAIEEELTNRGYRLAASTIDTSDYMFNDAYVRAHGNDALRDRIARAYLEYSRIEIRYYQELNREVLGRTPPAILLLHHNEINADVLDEVIAIFRAEGFGFVSLEEAQADRAYDTSPAFATPYGPMWGYRWARERGVWVNGAREQEPPKWIREYANSGEPPAL